MANDGGDPVVSVVPWRGRTSKSRRSSCSLSPRARRPRSWPASRQSSAADRGQHARASGRDCRERKDCLCPGWSRRARAGAASRSYLDPGRTGPTRFISNNNAAFRRSAFLTHPLPTASGPFASRRQSEAILRAGGRLLFEPGMRVVHAFEGWAMEGDIRRNVGYGTIITRLCDRSLPYAWLTRLGSASIPIFAAAKTLDSWGDCIRCARHYGVRWYELPFALESVPGQGDH